MISFPGLGLPGWAVEKWEFRWGDQVLIQLLPYVFGRRQRAELSARFSAAGVARKRSWKGEPL